MDLSILQRMELRRGELNNERSPLIPVWDDVTKFISPRMSRLPGEKNRTNRGYQNIINETATLASRTLASGLMAGMSSAARPWFNLGPPDPGMKAFGPVRDWLEAVTKILRESFVRSNLYTILPFAYRSEGDYGTGAFAVLEDEEEVLRCYPFSVGTFLVGCNDRMQVDTCYREFSMTVKQLVQRFGKKDRNGKPIWDNFSTQVKNLYDRGNYGASIPVIHAVEPNLEHRPGSPWSWQKPYVSVYYEPGRVRGEQPLSISGFDDFPIMAPRWFVDGEDTWGIDCPGMMTVGAVKALQLGEKRSFQAIDKLVNPPVNADATLRNVGVDLLPGGVNWTSGMGQGQNAGVRPVYEINPRIQELEAKMVKIEGRISRCYYEDLMLMLARSDNPQMTAREIDERHEEKMWALGPMLEQQNDDLFDRIIDRSFNIHLRRGLLPPPPKELQEMLLRVEYVSIMAQAQKLVGVATQERFIGFLGTVAAMNPSVLDKVDLDNAVDEYAEMTGVSPKIIVSDEEVLAIRENRKKAEQAQQMMAGMPAARDGADALKALTEVGPEGVTNLRRMITGAA